MVERKIRQSDTSHRVRLYRDRLPALGIRRKREPTVVKLHVVGRPPCIYFQNSAA
jgi:hypothetical protein